MYGVEFRKKCKQGIFPGDKANCRVRIKRVSVKRLTIYPLMLSGNFNAWKFRMGISFLGGGGGGGGGLGFVGSARVFWVFDFCPHSIIPRDVTSDVYQWFSVF